MSFPANVPEPVPVDDSPASTVYAAIVAQVPPMGWKGGIWAWVACVAVFVVVV
jgi:hypothetical protein